MTNPDETRIKVEVIVNPDEQDHYRFIDNGLGMTAEEVEEYINQIAFSGAAGFLEQVQGQGEQRTRSSVISDSVSTPHSW